MAGTGNVTLVCGMCGGTRGMFADEWERYKKIRAEDGRVVLCEAIVRGTKNKKCHGVMYEKSEAFGIKQKD
jgi:hypothetical protein